MSAVIYESPKIGIIGLGHFGKALAEGILSHTYSHVLGFNRSPVELSPALAKGLDLRTSIKDVMAECQIILLAVRPQNMMQVLTDLKDYEGLVISFAAGLPLDYYTSRLPHTTVVRAMTNLGVAYGKGMTVWVGSENMDAQIRWMTQSVFSDLGNVIELDLEDESQIDTVTALSGSGIAYLAQVFDTMKTVGVNHGMTESNAEKVVLQTVSSVLALFHNTELSLDEIVAGVASKGGTTEAGLKTMDEKGLKTALTQGLEDTISKCNSLSRL